MQSFSFCKALDARRKEECLSRIIDVLVPADSSFTSEPEDDSKTNGSTSLQTSDYRASRLSQYLKQCRSSTIKNDKSLAPLFRENHSNPDSIKLGDSSSCAAEAT